MNKFITKKSAVFLLSLSPKTVFIVIFLIETVLTNCDNNAISPACKTAQFRPAVSRLNKIKVNRAIFLRIS